MWRIGLRASADSEIIETAQPRCRFRLVLPEFHELPFPRSRGIDAWNSPAMVTRRAESSRAEPSRQEIIKRYPEWRKNYRRISRGLRGVVDGKEEEGRGERTSDIHNRVYTIRRHGLLVHDLTGGPYWPITPFFVT